MGRAFGPAHFLGAQRIFENDGTPYFVSLARGTKLFFNILRKYGTPLPYRCTCLWHWPTLHRRARLYKRRDRIPSRQKKIEAVEEFLVGLHDLPMPLAYTYLRSQA